MTKKGVTPSHCPSESKVKTDCQEKCTNYRISSSCITCVATILPESCEIPCTFCVAKVAFHWHLTCGGFASSYKEAKQSLQCLYGQFESKTWNICKNCIPTSVCWLKTSALECQLLKKMKRKLSLRYLPIKPCMDLTKFGQGYNWKCSNEEIVKGTQCRLNCWKRKYGVHNTTVECNGHKWKKIETGETISTSALDNMGWDCPKKTSRCKDWTKFGQGYNWKCSNEESVMGTQCRLNCWKGKYGVHNTTVECKGDKWKNIETGETISTSALDQMGWDCPKKTTTTSTTTTANYSGCDKEAFERNSNTTLTCTNDNVQLPNNLVGRGQNCTVKCNPVYEISTYVNVAVHEKYYEIFCSDFPDNIMSEAMQAESLWKWKSDLYVTDEEKKNLCKNCKVPVMYASRYHWICDLDNKSFGVMGSQCRLNCWDGEYGVHNTRVICKGNDEWMDLKTGEILSGREVDNLGWDCPKKTTTTLTMTTTSTRTTTLTMTTTSTTTTTTASTTTTTTTSITATTFNENENMCSCHLILLLMV